MIFEKFIALLNDVVIAYKADQQYQSYLQYIWSSLLIFIAQFNKQKFFEFIHKCEDWIATAHLDSKKNVYLNYHLEKARGEFVNKIAVEGET